MEDDFYDDYDEGDSEPLILAMGNDGKPTIKKPSDYVELEKKDMYLIQGFIKENQKLFNEYLKKNDVLSESSEVKDGT